jgi:hypothetical protein
MRKMHFPFLRRLFFPAAFPDGKKTFAAAGRADSFAPHFSRP